MFIRSLKLRNILSFHEPPPLELKPLNILIGPNASGKSNLIDCIGLLQALPGNISQYINDRGGPELWIWRGKRRSDAARVGCEFELDKARLNYEIAFSSLERLLAIQTEALGLARNPRHKPLLLKRFANRLQIDGHGAPRSGMPSISPIESVLSYRNPLGPVAITRAQHAFSDIRVYRGFDTGTRSEARTGISSAGPKLPLESNGSNLALVLQEMDFHGPMKKVKQYLSRLSSRFEDIKIRAEGGRSQVYIQERGVGMVSATRLSDGTLRFLCLVTILFDPKPAPLVCIEEPEIGLHPEALALVGDALREASQRTQIVITTHSDALVDRFTDEPEQIVVCERDFDEGTCFRRLSGKELSGWLKEYTLGDLWRRGGIGGAQR